MVICNWCKKEIAHRAPPVDGLSFHSKCKKEQKKVVRGIVRLTEQKIVTKPKARMPSAKG